MNYGRPELGERLAADYVLGLMPRRARSRFERAMTRDATLAAIVAGWSERLEPLDAITRDEAPSAHVWRAIEQRIGVVTPVPVRARRGGFFLWRGLMVTAVAACAAVVIYIAVSPMQAPKMAQMIAEKTGLSGWMATAPHPPADIGLSTIALGVPERERPRWVRAALLLSSDAVPLTMAPPR